MRTATTKQGATRWWALGAILGLGLGPFLPGCGECVDHVIYALDPGEKIVDGEPGQQPALGEDLDYRLVVSDDRKTATETFTRAGKAHRNVYALGEVEPSPVRTDRSPGSD